MKNHPRRRFTLVLGAGAVLAGLAFPAGAAAEAKPISLPVIPGISGPPGPLTTQPVAKGPVKLLKATPDSLHVGEKFTLSGEGLPPNEDVDVVWNTANGSYVMNPLQTNVEFHKRQFDKISVILAKARTDASGRVSIPLTVPRDYGEIHDLYLAKDGVMLAKGGVHVARKVWIDKKRGPLGTLITLTVTGLGVRDYENSVALRYDNKYMGLVSGVMTRGVGTAQFRAAGPVGPHVIEVNGGSKAVPYLNTQQSPVPWTGWFRLVFTVTADNGPPPPTVQFPKNVRPTDASSRTTQAGSLAGGVTAKLSTQSGPVLSKVDLSAAGLTPRVPVTLGWGTAVGNRVSPTGWSIVELPLGSATPAADGTLSTKIEIPDNLGGWHTVRLLQQGKVKAEIPFYVLRSIVGITPKTLKVKEGEVFLIHLKGIGWTELDNSVAVTYDNAYLGYACGFNSNGDVQVSIVATGGPGTHLIDVYPLLYQGNGQPPWQYNVPFLNFMQDAPGLALGYRLPAMRLAIEVVK